MENIRDNRVHKLLGVILKEFPVDNGTSTVRYEWTFEELAAEYKNTNIHEIGELCRLLTVEGLVEPFEHKIKFDSNQLRFIRQSYHSGKFKEKPDWINRFNLFLGVINIGILIYSAIIAYKTDDKVDMQSMTIESLTKNLEKTNTTLDSLKKENVLIQRRLDSLGQEIKGEK